MNTHHHNRLPGKSGIAAFVLAATAGKRVVARITIWIAAQHWIVLRTGDSRRN